MSATRIEVRKFATENPIDYWRNSITLHNCLLLSASWKVQYTTLAQKIYNYGCGFINDMFNSWCQRKQEPGEKSNYQRFNGVRSLKRMAFLVHRNENKVIPFLHGKREMLQIDKFSNKNYWMQLINLGEEPPTSH